MGDREGGGGGGYLDAMVRWKVVAALVGDFLDFCFLEGDSRGGGLRCGFYGVRSHFYFHFHWGRVLLNVRFEGREEDKCPSLSGGE